MAQLVIPEQDPERLSARSAKLLFVDLKKNLALVEIHGPIKIAAQFPPREVQDPNFHAGAVRRLVHQIVQATP